MLLVQNMAIKHKLIAIVMLTCMLALTGGRQRIRVLGMERPAE